MSAGADRPGRIAASPLARRIAREHGVDLAGLRGSGPAGRIVAADVFADRAADPAAPPAPLAPQPSRHVAPEASTFTAEIDLAPLTKLAADLRRHAEAPAHCATILLTVAFARALSQKPATARILLASVAYGPEGATTRFAAAAPAALDGWAAAAMALGARAEDDDVALALLADFTRTAIVTAALAEPDRDLICSVAAPRGGRRRHVTATLRFFADRLSAGDALAVLSAFADAVETPALLLLPTPSAA
jgi:pyruvate dehydrogenase E2 component (dihydrolipoamide acetyltransferase)